jgi:hypothetical protein
MALTFQIGSFTLDATNNITVAGINYDDGTELRLNTLPVARRPGAKVISAVYQARPIKLSGTITGTSLDDVQNKLDTFKYNTSGTQLNLDINDGIVNRRFIVSSSGPWLVPREAFSVTLAHWEITFEADDPPFGLEAVQGAATANVVNALTLSGMNSSNYTGTLSFSGSALPDVKTTVTIATSGSLNAFDIVDVVGGRTLTVSGNWQNNDIVVADSTNFRVTQNNVPLDFVGQFPQWQAGSNNQYGFNFYTTSGETLDQFQLQSAGSYAVLLGTNRYAQSFVPGGGNITRLGLVLASVGTGQNVQLTIQTDSGGASSGTILANSTQTISSANMQTIANWINVALSPNVTVSAGTTYWIVLTPTSNDQKNYVLVYYNTPNNYASGKFRTSINSGATYTDVASPNNASLMFKTYKSVTSTDTNTTIDYGANTETFANTTYRDGGTTTANWDTTNNRLQLPLAAPPATPYIQTAHAATAVGASSITTPGITTTTGNFIAITAVSNNPANSTITDSYNNTWTKAVSRQDGTDEVSIYFATNIIGGASHTFTHNTSGTTVRLLIIAQEFTNISISSPLDQTAMAISSLDSTATPTTTQAGELVIGSCLNKAALAAGTGYSNFDTLVADSGGFNINGATESKVVSTTGTYNATFTGANSNAISVIATFKAGYDSTKNIGQSLALLTSNADGLAAQIKKADTTPGSTAVAYKFSGDGTTFQTLTPVGSFSESSWTPVNTIGTSPRWNALLTGTFAATPTTTRILSNWVYGISVDGTAIRGAQAVVPVATNSVQRCDIYPYIVGVPGSMTLRIETDASNAPSGTLVNANATITVAPPAAGSWGWLSFNFPAAFTLNAATKYWIVCNAAATLNTTNKWLLRANNNRYPAGSMAKSTNSGSTYTLITTNNETMMFQLFMTSAGGLFSANASIDYTKRYL